MINANELEASGRLFKENLNMGQLLLLAGITQFSRAYDATGTASTSSRSRMWRSFPPSTWFGKMWDKEAEFFLHWSRWIDFELLTAAAGSARLGD